MPVRLLFFQEQETQGQIEDLKDKVNPDRDENDESRKTHPALKVKEDGQKKHKKYRRLPIGFEQ